ncbi:MAG: tyrosine-type recombinase/integrase [Proteobacteria bacterium]|nr:tyrosine-type recombinase/integrase [Pseudomonadota bacterium]
MPVTKLTKRFINGLTTPGNEQVYWDEDLPGFGLRVRPSGRRTFIVQYRNAQGRTRKVTIGLYGHLTPDEARGEARQVLAGAARGQDPAEVREADRHSITVTELSDRYMNEYAITRKKPLSVEADERLFRLVILPALGKRKVAEITRQDAAKLHHDFRAEPYKANRALALLSKMFNLAEKWGLRPDGSNPCRHVDKYPEKARERFLSPDELGRLGKVLDEIERNKSEYPSVVTAIRLLVLAGCRKSEIQTLKWEHVDFDLGVIRLPDSKTGAKIIPLGKPALEYLEKVVPEDSNPYVCPGRKTGAHLVGLQKAWERIRARAGLDDVRLHDLRHSFASVGAADGMGLPIIGALLGHRKSSTTERYAHLSTDPLREAATKISTTIDEAMKSRPKVVRLAKTK